MVWRLRTFLFIAVVGAIAGVWLLLRPAPISVETAQVNRGLFVRTILNEGKTRVRDRYVVSAPIAGMLGRVTLKAGDPVDGSTVVAIVSPGQTPLDDPRARRQLEERLGVAEAAHNRATVAEARARARQLQAQADLARTRLLAERGVVATARREQDELAATVAERELQVAQFDVHVTEHEEALARAALQTDAAGDGARAIEIKSPVDGVVLKLIQESEGPIAVGAPIMEIGDPARLEIVVDVLTTDAVQIAPGAPATIERWGGSRNLQARVARVEPGGFTKVSALGIDEQRVFVILDIVSPRVEWKSLGDAYRVEARIETARAENVLVAPVSALFRSGSGWAVFVAESGRARMKHVAVAQRNDTEAVISNGLAEKDAVILFPPPPVSDGVAVAVRKSTI